jgi:nicotinamide phosphoribosyltransferase
MNTNNNQGLAMNINALPLSIILDADSYKYAHWVQYPKNTKKMRSFLESRGGKYSKTVMFGLQYYLKAFLTRRITVEDVEEAKEISELHGVPFNYEGWMRIATVLEGKLPVRIRAVPEGMIVPVKNILMDIESTDEETFWVASWLETLMLRIWYTITVATHSYNAKQLIYKYLKKSCENPDAEIVWKLHDFGGRGVTCQEQAMLGGASHLVNFLGSDTVAGIMMARKFYGEKMAGFSIPASEHSTMTMWGREGEVEAMRNMIKSYGDGFIFACVSDQYDYFNACRNIWAKELREEILAMKATLVVRPDSGDPVECIVEGLKIFAESFGYTVNKLGYKVVNKVRMIQGDGINEKDIERILEAVLAAGFSAENVGFGMGGGLLQKDINRDTQKFAFKCCWAMIDGQEVNVFKDPITDQGKRSKKGRLALRITRDPLTNAEVVRTLPEDDVDAKDNLLELVYENGEIKKEYTFAEVRENTKRVFEQHIGWVNRDVY